MSTYGLERYSCHYTRHESMYGSRSTAPLMLNLGTRWKWEVNITPRSLYPWEITQVPTKQENVWASESIWMFGRRTTCPCRDSRPEWWNPYPSRQTDCAIPAPLTEYHSTKAVAACTRRPCVARSERIRVTFAQYHIHIVINNWDVASPFQSKYTVPQPFRNSHYEV